MRESSGRLTGLMLGASALLVAAQQVGGGREVGLLDVAWAMKEAETDAVQRLEHGPLDEPELERFPVMFDAYDPEYLEVARAAARRLDITLREGVYLAISGPAYSTRAELRALSRQYTEEHPLVRRATERVDNIQYTVVPQLAGIVVDHLDQRMAAMDQLVNSAAGELRAIPPRTIDEARFTRAVQSAAALFSRKKRTSHLTSGRWSPYGFHLHPYCA